MNFQKLKPNAILPTQSYDGAAGYDLYSTEEVILPSFDPIYTPYVTDVNQFLKTKEYDRFTRKFSTGLAVEIPANHAGLFRDRSSYGAGGIIVTGGVIDPDYRGELIVCLLNLNSYTLKIPSGSKIVQMLVTPVVTTPPKAVDFLSQTSRGDKGFGSTGG